jgi:hypothetical protein
MTDFVAGDTGSTIQTTCVDSIGFEPIKLTDYSVALQWRDATNTIRSKNMTIVDAGNGIVEYTFVSNELVAPSMIFDVVLTSNTTSQRITCKDMVKIVVRDRV